MHDKSVALVTGSNKGIGLEICRQLAKKNITVILTARDHLKGEEALKKLNTSNVYFHALDITNPDSIEDIYDFVLKKFGRIDILINNAGIFLNEDKTGNVLTLDIQHIRKTMETNLYGAIRICQKFVPLMQKHNFGRIINISSQLGQLSSMNKTFTAYKISKTALNAFTRIIADELKEYNIKVNSICPGWCKTDLGGWDAERDASQGADTAVWLALQPDNSDSGFFFMDRKKIDW